MQIKKVKEPIATKQKKVGNLPRPKAELVRTNKTIAVDKNIIA